MTISTGLKDNCANAGAFESSRKLKLEGKYCFAIGTKFFSLFALPLNVDTQKKKIIIIIERTRNFFLFSFLLLLLGGGGGGEEEDSYFPNASW